MDRLASCAMEVEKPRRMIVRGLDGKPLSAADGSVPYFDVYSTDSEPVLKYDRALADEKLAMLGRATVSASSIDEEAIGRLVAMTAGWGVIKAPVDGKDGEVVPATDFTPAEARKLYIDPKFVDVARQVHQFAASKVNFAKASPKN